MKQNKETLKTYFETGDKPTQQQYIDLIDSLNTPFIGEIKAISSNKTPSGWAKCDGQLLNIPEYQDLFDSIGTIYGGDGVSTFALPDLRGRTPLGTGNNPELSNYSLGQKGGEETHTLTEEEMPSHNHIANSVSKFFGQNTPGDDDTIGVGVSISSGSNSGSEVFSETAPNTEMNASSVTTTTIISNQGGSQPFNIRSPYQALNYIIALEGRTL